MDRLLAEHLAGIGGATLKHATRIASLFYLNICHHILRRRISRPPCSTLPRSRSRSRHALHPCPCARQQACSILAACIVISAQQGGRGGIGGYASHARLNRSFTPTLSAPSPAPPSAPPCSLPHLCSASTHLGIRHSHPPLVAPSPILHACHTHPPSVVLVACTHHVHRLWRVFILTSPSPRRTAHCPVGLVHTITHCNSLGGGSGTTS